MFGIAVTPRSPCELLKRKSEVIVFVIKILWDFLKLGFLVMIHNIFYLTNAERFFDLYPSFLHICANYLLPFLLNYPLSNVFKITIHASLISY